MENSLEKIYDGFLYGIGFMGSLSLFAFMFFFIGIVFLLLFSFFRKKLLTNLYNFYIRKNKF